MTRLYLDNAATSFPKPAAVSDAVVRYMTDVGATPGRASYAESLTGGSIIARCRRRIADLLRVGPPEHVIFTLNTTDALNLAIKGLTRGRRRANNGRPLHVVATAMEHNSVLRPLNALASEGVSCTFVPADPRTGVVDPAAIGGAIHADTCMVVLNHVSNVTGVVQDAAAVGEVCRRHGVTFLLDAAQSLGHIDVDNRAIGADLVAFPGHKGLLGPLGTGGLFIRPGLETRIDPLREGGTGTVSERDTQPDTLPERFEPGSHNAPGIAGLSEGVAFHLERGHRDHFAQERRLVESFLGAFLGAGGRALDRPDDTDGILRELTLVGPSSPAGRTGIFTVTHASLSSHELAALLESEYGMLTRPGLHCAPRAHAALASTGALRISVGPFVTEPDVRAVVDALAAICRGVTRTTVGVS